MSEPLKEVPVSFTRRYKQVEHTCPVCGTVFLGSPLAIYDKDACREKAQWERRSEKINARRRQERKERRKAQDG